MLFPNRRELARVMARLFALKYLNYPTDHIMTKTTYLDDPEGAPPPLPDAVGLRHFAVELPNQDALDAVIARVDEAGTPANQTENGLLLYDPSQNGILLTKKS